jgi:hypothetical protein
MLMRISSRAAWWLLAVWIAGYATLRGQPGKALDSPITVAELVAFLIVFCIIVSLGLVTASIASRKGGNYTGWSYYGLLLPLIALPHALLKKTRISPPTVAS